MRLAFALLLLAGCGETRLVVAMVAENNSGQSGTATLEEEGKALHVNLELKALEGETLPQKVHFHRGQCGEISTPVIEYPGTSKKVALELASVRDDGMVRSLNTLEGIKLGDVTDGTWVLNVHDPRDNSLYTSCGNVR